MDVRLLIEQITTAIDNREILRIGYSHLHGGPLSLHRIAPVDVRPGDSAKTSRTLYLWAFCYDRNQPETHLLTGIRTLTETSETFDPLLVLRMWPDRWPLPPTWAIPRDWPTFRSA